MLNPSETFMCHAVALIISQSAGVCVRARGRACAEVKVGHGNAAYLSRLAWSQGHFVWDSFQIRISCSFCSKAHNMNLFPSKMTQVSLIVWTCRISVSLGMGVLIALQKVWFVFDFDLAGLTSCPVWFQRIPSALHAITVCVCVCVCLLIVDVIFSMSALIRLNEVFCVFVI